MYDWLRSYSMYRKYFNSEDIYWQMEKAWARAFWIICVIQPLLGAVAGYVFHHPDNTMTESVVISAGIAGYLLFPVLFGVNVYIYHKYEKMDSSIKE